MEIESTKSLVEKWRHTMTLVDPESGMKVSVSGTIGDSDVMLELEHERPDNEDGDRTMGFLMPAKDFLALADRVRKSMATRRRP